MIVAYHRPTSMDEALGLLSRSEPETLPLGGGTILSRPGPGRYAVVDLQALGLDGIERQGNRLVIGAVATLQSLYARADIPAALREAIRRETTYNLRQTASVAGALVSADGKSPFAAALLALDAVLVWAPDGQEQRLEAYFQERKTQKQGLILRVAIPVDANLQYEAVAKTPADVPMLCGAVGGMPDGSQRVVLGGFGDAPVCIGTLELAQSDAQRAAVVEQVINNAYSQYSNLFSVNSDFQKSIIATLVRRLTSASE
jgi:CO/xanthine dehydrogenase FAD-binding subunit